MIELQKFLNNFEKLVNELEPRGIGKERLLFIKDNVEKRNKLIDSINKIREERNRLSKKGIENADLVKVLKKEISEKEEEKLILDKVIEEMVSFLPNIPSSDTPTNKEGNKTKEEIFYDHDINHGLKSEEIIKKLNLIDEDKSIKLSGSKFVVYRDFGSKLLRALINFMLSENGKRGYTLFDIPYLVNKRNHYNVGQLPKFEEDLYKIENSNFYLIPTSETVLVNFYQDQIIEEIKLPIKMCSYSPCFRSEAGSAGQENKGIIRLHQFNKVELVRIVNPEESYLHLNQIVSDAQNILKILKISHRVIDLCHEELGFSSSKTYDIEVWLPISKK